MVKGGGSGKEHGSMRRKENSRLGNVMRSTVHTNFISDRLHCFLEFVTLAPGRGWIKRGFFNLTKINQFKFNQFRCNPQFQLFLNVDTNKRNKGIFDNFIELKHRK